MSNNEPIPFKRKAPAAERILEQLRESERIFALLVASVKDYGIFMLDVEGRVSTWNAGAELIQGYIADEIIGQHFSIFYTPDAVLSKHPQYELERAVSSGGFEEEGWRVRKDGTRFWAAVTITPVYHQDQLLGFANVVRDLSERRQAEVQREEAVRQAEIFRLLVSNVKDYAIFMLDENGIVKTWNEGAQRIQGYTAEEIIGQHFSKFYLHEARNIQHPQRELRIAASEGSYEEEGWRVKKDGSRFWASVVITAVWQDKKLVGFAKVTRDLTERRAAEEARKEAARQEAQFRLMVESVKDYAIFMLDPSGNVKTWNAGAERINGYTREEIVGKHFSTFYPQDARDRRHPEKELEIASETGWYEEEGWRLKKDGSMFWANVLITAVKENGELIGFVKVTRDLTERRAAEKARERAYEDVRKANDELQLIAYSVSHELQEPVTAITSYSKLLKSRYSGRLGSDADEFLSIIDTGAKTAARLVDDLWLYARISKPDAPHSRTSIGKLLRDAQEELANLISKRSAEITHHGYDSFPILIATVTRFATCLKN
jgi:PAS domain S-box-containing protein